MSYTLAQAFAFTGGALAGGGFIRNLQSPLVSEQNIRPLVYASAAATCGYLLARTVASRRTPAGLIKRAQALLDQRDQELLTLIDSEQHHNLLEQAKFHYARSKFPHVDAFTAFAHLQELSDKSKKLLLQAQASDHTTAHDIAAIYRLLQQIDTTYFNRLNTLLIAIKDSPHYTQELNAQSQVLTAQAHQTAAHSHKWKSILYWVRFFVGK
jgi:hypothetical protein